jgi:hypothetical protein
MILPQSQFRLLKEYKKHLPNINDSTIFAYNKIIYSNQNLPADLVIHEQEHFKQQEKYGLKNWVKRYLNEKSFRLEMEKEAYRVQISSIKDKGLKEAVRKDCINALCSGLYGQISREQAEKILEIKVKNKVDSLVNL